MLTLVAISRPAHVVAMTTKRDDRDELILWGRALASVRNERGINQADAGAAFGTAPGISSQAWGQYEAGNRPGIFRPDVQSKLAAALGATVEDLLDAKRRLAGDPPNPRIPGDPRPVAPRGATTGLYIRDTVQAGAFLVANDLSQEEPTLYPHASDGRYPHADQWLSRVRGDSVNLLGIFDGDLVHCVSTTDIAYTPRTGDIVEVERTRFGGQMRELTLKQVEVTPNGPMLWPRSTNERFREPVSVTEGADHGEELEVRIRGLVVGSIRRY
jgi:transcriptional regulator with XRE-family HTH domain